MIDEMFCVEQETLEHMSTDIGVEHNLWSIRSFSIVSLGVSYKYILAFSVEQGL